MGTSLGEILHFVCIPGDSDDSQISSFIFASRLRPKYMHTSNTRQLNTGVQQILLLLSVNKACILCNGTLTFYSLPELSPAFKETAVIPNCTSIGGKDLENENSREEVCEDIMICSKSRIGLFRIGEELKLVRKIEFPSCLNSARRKNFACVSDAFSYALLDVENQQKISLFSISSLDDNMGAGRVEDISTTTESNKHIKNSVASRPNLDVGVGDSKVHGRSTSLGTFVGGLGRRQESLRPSSRETLSADDPGSSVRAISLSRGAAHSRSESTSVNLDMSQPMSQNFSPHGSERTSSLKGSPDISLSQPPHLKPHIFSPSSSEFLLTTGTALTEPGVGLFVNLDGDVVRGTIEFSQYPNSIALDTSNSRKEGASSIDGSNESYVLAAMNRLNDNHYHPSIEIQKLATSESEQKEWLDIPKIAFAEESLKNRDTLDIDLRTVLSTVNVPFPEVGHRLKVKRLRIPGSNIKGSTNDLEKWELSRNEEEAEFARRLGGLDSNIVVWSGSSIWWVVKNPLAMKLDVLIDQAFNMTMYDLRKADLDRNKLIQITRRIRDHEPKTETEYLSLGYIRQKISLVLFCDLIIRTVSSSDAQNADKRITEGLLMEGGIDPRIILSMIHLFQEDIVEGPKGIWVPAGLVPVINYFWSVLLVGPHSEVTLGDAEILGIIKRYLQAWRQRKGFGSITDEAEVFQTIDAVMLHLLLYQASLDHAELLSSSSSLSSRNELYVLVDSGISCFDRAVVLLERYRRLYVLSRLYQSHKMVRKVLETWKRMIDEEDSSDDRFPDGENKIREYLSKLRDQSLVQEFGTWLARRNPFLGVQVFTDDHSKVKFEPHQVVQLLQGNAPQAVKVYLEHLVFGKKYYQYANDLIAYYLNNVLSVLENSGEARKLLSNSYAAYRVLDTPKPTYRQFIVENAVAHPWWHDRLRLLELLGGSHGSDFSYDMSSILSRIEPFEQYLVPESIILDGRQGRHRQALRLLTHGLGDYHTAVNYCLLGGASIFYPASGSTAQIKPPSKEEQTTLFGYLLGEFLCIEEFDSRVERTSELLARFGSWYDIRDVLNLVPESWSVELISDFLVNAFRRLIQERNEVVITKALSGAENLQIASTLIEKCDQTGPHIQDH